MDGAIFEAALLATEDSTYQPPSLRRSSLHQYSWLFATTHLVVLFRPIALASKIFLRVHHHAFPSGESVFEKRVVRCQGHSVVAALDDEVDLRQHGLHLGQTGGMMAEIV
jgi:hypothetical protein